MNCMYLCDLIAVIMVGIVYFWYQRGFLHASMLLRSERTAAVSLSSPVPRLGAWKCSFKTVLYLGGENMTVH